MQIFDDIYKDNTPLYPIEEFCPQDKALFIDIETTGLSKETTSLYLIGCGFYSGNDFYTKLFFADNEDEELSVISAFIDFMRSYTHLFHFNGNKFDIPYLKYKSDQYNLGNIFENMIQIDVYGLIKPLRYLLFPDSMKQKSVENFLGISRDDKYNGGELIEVYKSYTKCPTESSLKDLITHNREDVLGMHMIMPILHYLDIEKKTIRFTDYTINEYTDYSGCRKQEVIFTYHHDFSIPKSFFSKTDTMYIKVSATESTVLIRLPIVSGEMKLFFDNYRDYCYLPEEDTCILKTLCQSLPKDRYKKATKDTCYLKAEGTFMRQPEKIFSPSFKCSYKDKASYFRFPEDFTEDKRDEFGTKLLNVFFHIKRSPQK